jgi:hypothetical protein
MMLDLLTPFCGIRLMWHRHSKIYLDLRSLMNRGSNSSSMAMTFRQDLRQDADMRTS